MEVLQSPVDQMREAVAVVFVEGELVQPLRRMERKRISRPELIELGEAGGVAAAGTGAGDAGAGLDALLEEEDCGCGW
ncbi:MAG: hypothetical protein R3E79_24320 [Caldilineaceae bacterium]